MKKITLVFALTLLCYNANFAQTNLQKAQNYIASKGEVCFVFTANSEAQVEEISQFLTIGHKVNRETLEIEAYGNEETFAQFLTYGLPYRVNQSDNEFNPHASPSYDVNAWDTTWDQFPTYSQYVSKMNYFASNYPSLCTLEVIGTTSTGRELLMLKISDNVASKEAEPEFLYTSSMHGDELTGYPLMIRLIDYLLTNYGTDTEVTDLVNSTEIYINPLANPDGAYRAAGSNTITNPRRGNANNIDLNRNYADDVAGIHYDGNDYEAETKAFMDWEANHNIVLSANFHGGTEVVNYPYDNTYTKHADHDFYEHICNEYAVNAQNDSPNNYYNGVSGRNAGGSNHPNYMTVEYDDPENPSSPGVTQGVIWYQVYGGRQDYMNFYRHSKEVTIELSFDKFVNPSELPNLWTFNKQALLDYIKQANSGFQGLVTDESGNPIVAQVSIAGHDAKNSNVFSDKDLGDYYRLIKGGTYNVTFEAPGYVAQTISVTVTDNTTTVQNVTMVASTAKPTALDTTINTGEAASLTASGNGTLNWYTSETEKTPVYTGANYTTPALTETTTYYVEDVISKPNAGSLDNSANGNQFTGGSTERYLVFSSTEQVRLKSVEVNAGNTGEMEVQLQDSSGNMLDSRLVFIETPGVQDIDLNFVIPIGTNMRLASKEMSSGFTLWRNNTGTNYPYTNGPINITTSNVSTQYYYFFYDWKIEEVKSAREDVVVVVEDTLSVAENDLESTTIYPNPFNNTINIKLPSQYSTESISVEMYDALGRTIRQFSVLNSNNGAYNISNLDNLSNGTYFVKITDNNTNNSIVKQLIKQ
ncbi:M14 family zinc carboxypeptidase [Ichthyenterobacterium sp. W332]|uniref:M14 family zinc carboxypeptidase n=1 Tax=Microcosmobacter mediterraneus TaxID=3075607 RepID=A0ABU2YNE1_9FLAO|nr:M14 family zinc carboxypeptidase [Ichthyenterobacterium sp. W332]MDT0559406.1 M14 family zinc carboxypeptidase [Ichthyenterobacterium sp. W332]